MLNSKKNRQYWLQLILFSMCYTLLACITIRYLSSSGHVSIVWLPSGLALFYLLQYGVSFFPAVFLGAFFANWLTGLDGFTSLFIGIGNCLEALCAYTLLKQCLPFKHDFYSTKDYLSLVVAAITGAALSAAIGIFSVYFSAYIPADQLTTKLLNWWQGDALGLLVLTPFLCVWSRYPVTWLSSFNRQIELIICLSLNILAGQILFFDWLTDQTLIITPTYISFPLLIWAAIRFGRHGALLVIVINLLQGMLGAKYELGIFSGSDLQTSLLNFWYYIATISVGSILVSLVFQESKKNQEILAKSESRYKTLIQNIPFCVHEIDMHGRLTSMNKAGLNMLSLKCEQEIKGIDYLSAVSQKDKDKVSTLLERAKQGEAAFFEFEGVTQERKAHYSTCFIPLINNDGKQYMLMGYSHDISDELAIKKDLELASMVYKHSKEAMAVSDQQDKILTVNAAFVELMNLKEEQVIGLDSSLFLNDEFNPEVNKQREQSLKMTGAWQGEVMLRNKHGEIVIFALSINRIDEESTGSYRYVSQFYDITQSREQEKLIWRQANYDVLTDLPNRNYFTEKLKQYILQSKKTNGSFVLLFIDLNNFKEVNESLGHHKGDLLLKEVSYRLQNCLREMDVAARQGGDEFSAILSGLIKEEHINVVVNDLISSLSKHYILGDSKVFISACVGITRYPNDSNHWEDLLKFADLALFSAKSQGINRFEYFNQNMKRSVDQRVETTKELRLAIIKNELEVYYQPIINLKNNEVQKAEALLRWNHPEEGTLSPDEFITIAEASGLIIDIGNFVFKTAVNQVARWREKLGNDFQISINKSPVQFRNTEDPEGQQWLSYLQHQGLSGSNIALEITEGLLLDTPDIVMDKLKAYRYAGIKISLDDFGTGYSSLSYLQKFNIDIIKIDKVFVRDIAPGSNDLILCEAMIVMAHKLGLKVVAEGIETDYQYRMLKNFGCDFGQGYYVSPPLKAADYYTWHLDHHNSAC